MVGLWVAQRVAQQEGEDDPRKGCPPGGLGGEKALFEGRRRQRGFFGNSIFFPFS